ncbi:MAG: biotin--[acetyl-CoA-carboxylase] ligase [Candidatus Eremiobacteraeota bacterium]|nr:biotin--[acetyl-CoA-carboxylase] ligase [Candidatus Eremiobacteraeota bacterium]
MMVPEAGPYESLAHELTGSPFSAIRYVEETESTNADAALLLPNDDRGGLTIVAEYQRGGSGRKGRQWEAPAGSALLCTTILPRTLLADQLWLVPYWTALAVRGALAEFGITTLLQWPNDLLLRERKIAGILCLSSVAGNAARVACGVGINVYRFAGADHRVVPAPAFCDDAVTVERRALLGKLLRRYEASLPVLDEPEVTIRLWNEAAHLPGRRYRIVPDNGTPFEATALGLEPGGGLRVRRGDAAVEIVALADARIER